MPLPSGLKFRDRIARHGKRWYFLCQRKGHSKVWQGFAFETDAKEFRSAHDTAHHHSTFRHVGFEPARNIRIEDLCAEWRAHVAQLELDGIRSPETSRHYETCCGRLIDACKGSGVRTVRDLDPSRISAIVRWFRKHTATDGALTVKALSALRTMAKWKGLPADWKIPLDEIRAKKHPKRDIDAPLIRRLIDGMPKGSLEEAVTWLKARAGVRDVEIRDAVPEEFEFDVRVPAGESFVTVGVFAPVLHSKRKQKRHVYILTADTAAIVRPWVTKAASGEPVFALQPGKKLAATSLRRRFVAASKEKRDAHGNVILPAITPPITSIAPIRAEVVTILTDEFSGKEAADFIGHDDEATGRRWYYKDKTTQKKLAQLSHKAEALAGAIPLRSEAVN